MPDTIIVVDDEREIADLIGLYLENDGYEERKARLPSLTLCCLISTASPC